MEMFISFALNEIIDQQSDPENIRDKSLLGFYFLDRAVASLTRWSRDTVDAL